MSNNIGVDFYEDDASLQNHPLKEWAKRPTTFPLQELHDLNPEQLAAAQEAIRRIVEGE